jgi:acetylornithine deacetylase/succinyl-diaminopimelate desuccinylase-like protein
LTLKVEPIHEIATTPCNAQLQERLAKAVAEVGARAIKLPSGAGHDGLMLSKICPIAILFVRCKGGVSHNPANTRRPPTWALRSRGASCASSKFRSTAMSDAEFHSAVDFLKALVQVPSDNPPGDCAAHAAATAKLLESMEFVVERHLVPKSHVERHGMRSVVNLVVREKFGAGRGPTIALNAHGDVVPPGEGWSVDPYGAVEKDGAIYGRGAAVSKSDFTTYVFALRALKADRHRSRRPYRAALHL